MPCDIWLSLSDNLTFLEPEMVHERSCRGGERERLACAVLRCSGDGVWAGRRSLVFKFRSHLLGLSSRPAFPQPTGWSIQVGTRSHQYITDLNWRICITVYNKREGWKRESNKGKGILIDQSGKSTITCSIKFDIRKVSCIEVQN